MVFSGGKTGENTVYTSAGFRNFMFVSQKYIYVNVIHKENITGKLKTGQSKQEIKMKNNA